MHGQPDSDWQEEAEAFDRRLKERLAAGFVPDIRNAPRCDYFYQSVWRDPHFVRLFWGEGFDRFLDLIRRHAGTDRRLSLLDVGCGPGYFSLEFYREGFDVVGIDVSEVSIQAAREVLAGDATPEHARGRLSYACLPVEQAHTLGRVFDVVLFSGILHHLEDLDGALEMAESLLAPGGLILVGEPSRDTWTAADAAQVTLVRLLLSRVGCWWEADLGAEVARDPGQLRELVDRTLDEFVNERDHGVAAQSPHDNASGGEEILAALRRHFQELEWNPGSSFIHRVLGGLRGPEEVVRDLAEILAAYDREGVREGWIRPSHFSFIGRRRP